MYMNNNDERITNRNHDDISSGSTSFNDPARYEQLNKELTHIEPATGEAASNDYILGEVSSVDPDYNTPSYGEPVYNTQRYGISPANEPVYTGHGYPEPAGSQQTYTRPAYTAPPHNQHSYGEHAGSKPGESGWSMYSPGICVNQPYPRTRESENNRHTANRGHGIAGFLRAVALVVVCALFSGAASYVILDYRITRGDFTQPTQVILGGNTTEKRHEENPAVIISERYDGMTAEDIYDMARTQVVGIITEAPGMFGLPGSSAGAAPVSGSGFIISADGYILTNFHVIEIAHRSNLPINVVLNDGTSYEAKVVGFEQSNDVAVLKINAAGLSPAIIGNSDNIRVGQTIYAVGNPFGNLVYTMTDGIVSALDRVVSVEGKSISTFQFSAAVNSGNSGGPIYNTEGEILGIVTAKVVRGNVEGIGFAIPINDAIEIASELIEHGYISGRPLIGITGSTVSSGHAEYYGWVEGVYIRSVNPDSAAETAGIAVGDIITALDGKEVTSMDSLRFILRSYRADDTTTITVWREGEYIDLTITFAEDMYAGQPQLRPKQEDAPVNP